MREIVLDPGFVQRVQELNAKRNIPSIVLAIAKALDQLPADMVDDVINHSLVTYSLAGKQLDQEELVLSLNELRKIRAEKGDDFVAHPTAKWNYLKETTEYQNVAKIVECQLEMGMILHTISGYLKGSDANTIDATLLSMEMFKENVEELVRPGKQITEKTMTTISRIFFGELIEVCSFYVGREEYICNFSACCENVGQFEIAFANLFILMANEPLTYVWVNRET